TVFAGGRLSLPTNEIAHLLSDGQADPNFNPGAGPETVPTNALPDQAIFAVTVAPDGRVTVGGTFNQFNGTPRSCVARLGVPTTQLGDSVNGSPAVCYQVQSSLGANAVNYRVVGGSLPPGMTLSS